MNDRRKNTQVLSVRDEARQQMRELRSQEADIQKKLHEAKQVVDGQIDYSEYDNLMEDLREVRAEMASLMRLI